MQHFPDTRKSHSLSRRPSSSRLNAIALGRWSSCRFQLKRRLATDDFSSESTISLKKAGLVHDLIEKI